MYESYAYWKLAVERLTLDLVQFFYKMDGHVHVIYRFQTVVDIKGVSDSFQGFLASVCFVIVRDLTQGIAGDDLAPNR